MLEACAALEGLASSPARASADDDGPMAATTFLKAGVYPSLLQVMLRYSECAALTASGCSLLTMLANASRAAKDKLVTDERGAAAIVTHALLRHSGGGPEEDTAVDAVDDVTVCEAAARAVVALAFDSQLAQSALGEAGAIDGLLSALLFHREHNTTCCRVIVAALSAVCSKSPSNILLLEELEGVDDVVRAARYSGDAGLTVEVCRVIPTFCGDPKRGDISMWRATATGSAAVSLACALLQVSVLRSLTPDLALQPEPEPEPEPEVDVTRLQPQSLGVHVEKRMQRVDAACRALEALLQEDELRLLAMTGGVLQLFVTAMRAHIS